MSIKTSGWFVAGILLGLLAASGTVGCKPGEQTAAQAAPAPEENRVNVRVSELRLERLVETLTITGETEADRNIVYSSEVAGRLDQLSVDLGDRVSAGQELAVVDFEMLSAQAAQAQAGFDLAKKTYERQRSLRKDGMISQQSLDEAEARMVQTETNLQLAQLQLEKSRVKSAVDGIVARKFVEQGEFMAPGTPIVQVVEFREIVVTAPVPEREVSRVHRGAPVSVDIESLGESFQGTVEVVVPASNPLSKTFQVRVRVPNPQYRILVGMAARLSIELDVLENVIVAPQEAVVEEGLDRSVFVESEGHAVKRAVILGPVDGQRVMLREGVHTGERLIVSGQRELVDGQPVRVVTD